MTPPDDPDCIPLEEFLARYIRAEEIHDTPPPRPRVRRSGRCTITSLQGGPRGLLTPFSRRFPK